ncbi:unnamed protein product [Absidia cylindrospora]
MALSNNTVPNDKITATRFIAGLMEARHAVGGYVQKLNLGNYMWKDAELLAVIKCVPLLEDMTINNGIHIASGISLVELPRHCPNLTSLSMTECEIFSAAFFQALGEHCHQLRRLSLVNCPPLSPDMFAPLISCPLEKFYIVNSRANWTTTATPDTLGRAVMDLIRFPHLTHLSLTRMSNHFIQRLLTSATISVPPWPQLVSFCVDGCLGMVEDTLVRFIETHPGLKHLSLCGGRFSDVVLDTMVRSLPYLSSVDLARNTTITARGVHRMVWNCRTLTFIQLPGCNIHRVDPQVTDDPSMDPEIGYNELIYLDQLDHVGIMTLQQGPNPDHLDDNDNALLVQPPI